MKTSQTTAGGRYIDMTGVVDTQRLAITILTDENFQDWSLSSESTAAFALASRLRLRPSGYIYLLLP
jgi:hypothetical protein